jgi:hypothetical protein
MNARRLVSFVLTLFTITINSLANILPFNGQQTGEISDRFPIRFVPAGYVFAIWGVIYIGLLAFAIFQLLPRTRKIKVLDDLAPLYWVASIANALWIFLWHYEYFPLTLLVMLVLLLSLIGIYRLLSASRTTEPKTFHLLVQLPFSVYLGWISVASIANASQVLNFLNWDAWGLSAELWAVVMLVVASGLGWAMLRRERDMAFSVVLIWAFVGIALKQADSLAVSYSAWALAAGLAALLALNFISKKKPV